MASSRWERLAPLTGVLAVALWILGSLTLSVIGDVPDDSAPGDEFVTYYDEEEGSIFIGTYLFALGLAAFLWFLGSLRAALRQAEGGAGRLSAVSFGVGIVISVLLASWLAGDVTGAFARSVVDRELSPETAETLSIMGDGFYFLAIRMALPFFLAIGIVAIRYRALPVWLGWITVVLGILTFTPIGFIFFGFGLPLWTIVVSILLYLRGRVPAATPVSSEELRAGAVRRGTS